MSTDEHGWTRIKTILLWGCLLIVGSDCFGRALNVNRWSLKEGDLLFQTSRSAQSQAIQLATHSKWSHMGMLIREKGEWMVFEAVQPVRLTPLQAWVKRGQGGHVVIKRLRDVDRLLPEATLLRMKAAGKQYLGKPYDLTFEWDDRRIYCSELVWKVYKEGSDIELGSLQRLKDFDLSHPAVQSKMRERFGTKIPMNEPVISPQAMFECPLLTTVVER